jgi:hypothetical protein
VKKIVNTGEKKNEMQRQFNEFITKGVKNKQILGSALKLLEILEVLWQVDICSTAGSGSKQNRKKSVKATAVKNFY